jgi:hypothetical protein
MTNHTALTVSPRKNAMTAHAIAPSNAMMPKMTLCRVVIGDRSMIATGGRSLSVRIGDVAVVILDAIRRGGCGHNALPR